MNGISAPSRVCSVDLVVMDRDMVVSGGRLVEIVDGWWKCPECKRGPIDLTVPTHELRSTVEHCPACGCAVRYELTRPRHVLERAS